MKQDNLSATCDFLLFFLYHFASWMWLWNHQLCGGKTGLTAADKQIYKV